MDGAAMPASPRRCRHPLIERQEFIWLLISRRTGPKWEAKRAEFARLAVLRRARARARRKTIASAMQKGFSQSEIARQLGISPQAVSYAVKHPQAARKKTKRQ